MSNQILCVGERRRNILVVFNVADAVPAVVIRKNKIRSVKLVISPLENAKSIFYDAKFE